MGNRIVISESQYSRLFLGEQTKKSIGDPTNDPSYAADEYVRKYGEDGMGYDKDGFDDRGYDKDGYDKDGYIDPELELLPGTNITVSEYNGWSDEKKEAFDSKSSDSWDLSNSDLGPDWEKNMDKQAAEDMDKRHAEFEASRQQDIRDGVMGYGMRYYSPTLKQSIHKLAFPWEPNDKEYEIEKEAYYNMFKEYPADPLWKRKGFKNSEEYYRWWNDEGEYSYGVFVKDFIQFTFEKTGEVIYNIFDCGELEGKDYFHCVMGNASIAVSLVPILGTLASAIIDAADAVVYLGEAGADQLHSGMFYLLGDYDKAMDKQKESAMKLGWAGLSAMGIIPGVTEAKAIWKFAPKVTKAADNIVKELGQKGVKNIDLKEYTTIIKKHTEKLDEKTTKKVADLLDVMANPTVKKELIDIESAIKNYKTISDNFRKSNNLTKIQYKSFLNGSSFKKLMAKHGNDFNKAIKDDTIKKLISTFLVQAGLTTGIVVGVEGYKYTKEERLKQDAKKGNISSIVQLEGYDWDFTKKLFISSGNPEDNGKLKQAWKSGWRPWPKDESTGKAKDISDYSDKDMQKLQLMSLKWLTENPEFQTNQFQTEYPMEELKTVERGVTPEDPNDKVEGITYHTQKNIDLLNRVNSEKQRKINNPSKEVDVDSELAMKVSEMAELDAMFGL